MRGGRACVPRASGGSNRLRGQQPIAPAAETRRGAARRERLLSCPAPRARLRQEAAERVIEQQEVIGISARDQTAAWNQDLLERNDAQASSRLDLFALR